MGKNKTKTREEHHAEQESRLLEWQRRTGHRRPMSRREFLGAGLIQFSGMMALPSVLTLLAKSNAAYATTVCADSTSSLMPFVNINLAGGWSPVANWLPRDIGLQLLSGYETIGSSGVPPTVQAFANNALFTTNSNTNGFLAGVRSAASSDTVSKTSFIGIPVNSSDDTGNNRLSVQGLLTVAKLAGESLPGMGQADTASGVNQMSAFALDPEPPLRVDNVNDIVSALGFTNTLGSLNTRQQISLTRLVKNLSGSQARKLASLSGGENISKLVECATGKNVENISGPAPTVDPRRNSQLSTNTAAAAPTAVTGGNGQPLWNFGDQDELARSAMAMNAVSGLAGAVAMELGGFDYHGNTRATTDQKDREAGRLVGQVLQTAALMNKPVYIYVSTDGAVAFSRQGDGSLTASGDSGNRSALFVLAFRPTGAPAASSSQLGGFTESQTVDTDFFTATVETAAAAVFANWAKLSGDTSLINRVIPNVFSVAQLNQAILFG